MQGREGGAAQYYVEDADGQASGPWTREQLQEAHRQRRHRPDALVWTLQWSEWRPLSQALGALPAAPVQAPAPPRAERSRPQTPAPAPRLQSATAPGPASARQGLGAAAVPHVEATQRFLWGLRRVLARSLDTLLLGGAAVSAWLVFGTQQGAELMGEFDPGQEQSVVLAGFLMLLSGLLLEVPLIGLTGYTPGKALLGLRVVDSHGRPIGIAAAWRRIWRVALRGQALWIPPFWILAWIIALGDLSQHGQTHWDRALGVRMEHRKIEGYRWWLALAAIGLAYMALLGGWWTLWMAELA